MQTSGKKPNDLIHESSPYLLQHAYNPVNWLPYGSEAFEKALLEEKPVLISIGYSACHWCHVMEHESFENEEVAAIMNESFICVKVDREERSDVDNLYMQAVQMMTGHGGWPLNCFVLPDGKPFYGGTYFPQEQWKKLLVNISQLWKNEKPKVRQYADELTAGIVKSEELLTTEKESTSVTPGTLKEMVSKWKTRLDTTEGGPNKAPKFPLPSNYLFLLRYSLQTGDVSLQSHVELTLRKMAFGGIYDQLRGGFCRYSTDTLWKVPHFEKMLYDNAQLISLYAEAFQHTGNPVYRQVVKETMLFVRQNWYRDEGYFYSAFDADSEGEEGKYYVWTEEELRSILGEDFEIFRHYYQVNNRGYWEDGNYILMRNDNLAQVTGLLNMSVTDVEEVISRCRDRLLERAQGRVKPGLDDKTITSWNALMCSAAARAFLVFGDEEYRVMAEQSAAFLMNTMYDGQKLYRAYKNGEKKIEGFLEDYVFTAEALLQCYLLRGEERFLQMAMQLTENALQDFAHAGTPMLYYTAETEGPFVARTTEIADNVIPSSNSQMALNLFYLGRYFNRPEWIERSRSMLELVVPEMQSYGSAYSHWGILALHLLYPFHEIVVVGKNVDELFKELRQHGLTNSIFAVSAGPSALPLTENRYIADKTLIYICRNQTCGLPVTKVDEALSQMQSA